MSREKQNNTPTNTPTQNQFTNSEMKQIKEMACDMCTVILNCNEPCEPIPSCHAYQHAKRAFEKGYRKQREEIICGDSVERWKAKINRFVLDGLRQGAKATVVAEYIVDSILEEAICAVKEDEECRKQSEIIRCKDCEHFYQVGDVMICRHWNYHSTKDAAYCSFAKMKGGAE